MPHRFLLQLAGILRFTQQKPDIHRQGRCMSINFALIHYRKIKRVVSDHIDTPVIGIDII